MNNALLEIGTEHLPARFIEPALKQLAFLVKQHLDEQKLGYTDIKTYGTLKRLAVIIEGLPEKTDPDVEIIYGPPVKIWKTADGSFTPQAEGFARKNGTTADKLKIMDKNGNEHLAVRKLIKSQTAQNALSKVFESAVKGLEFPKNMIWEDSKFRFARPLRSLVCLFGDKIVKCEIAGVKAGRKTSPIWSLSNAQISIASANDYVKTLGENKIIADVQARKDELVQGLNREAENLGLKLLVNDKLVMETVYMTELPIPIEGKFNEKFLVLPEELIKTVFFDQLKFFPLINDKGELTNTFLAVRDGRGENKEQVAKGFEGVVSARLSDAVFFYENDLKVTLEEMKARLGQVLFHEEIGTMSEKSLRVEELSCKFCEALRQNLELDEAAVKKAASLAYADLTSSVVGEFGELQGYMGGQYAKHEGLSDKTAAAIGEFYFPLNAKSQLPSVTEAAIVSAAGKADTLASAFMCGMIPSGSEDPFGLRRQAIGLTRILLEKGFGLSLDFVADKAIETAAPYYKGKEINPKLKELLCEFLKQRFENMLVDQGIKFDSVRAVAQYVTGEQAEPLQVVYQRVKALENIRSDENFEGLLAGFKRISNIIKKAEIKQGLKINKGLFASERGAESELYGMLEKYKKEVAPSLDKNMRPSLEQFENALKRAAHLRPYIDNFFDEVMVMDKSESVRDNRLLLLNELYNNICLTADLSQIQN